MVALLESGCRVNNLLSSNQHGTDTKAPNSSVPTPKPPQPAPEQMPASALSRKESLIVFIYGLNQKEQTTTNT